MTTSPRFPWWTGLVLMLAVGLLGLVFLGPQKSLTVIPRSPADRNILRVACTQVMWPNPQRRNEPLAQHNQLILSLWEPLVECDPATGQPRPAAAQAWSWSDDRLKLTITLRPDARWSNGEAVTAQDFVRSWLHLLNQKKEGADILAPLKNFRAYQAGELKDAKALGLCAEGDHTLCLMLEKPRSTLVMELADPLLSPVHRSTEAVLKDQAYLENPALLVSNGPFHLVQANRISFNLEQNKFYHGISDLHLDGVRFVMADNLSIAQLMLAAGVVDILAPLPSEDVRAMPTDRRVFLESELEPTVNSIDFNVAHPPLSDVRVRQALALALDRVGPIEKYDPGHMIPAWSCVPDIPGRTGLKLLKEDAGQARQLLAAAGYPGGKGFPVLRMALPLKPRPNRFALAWAERWFQELGIKTYVSYEFSRKHMDRMKAGEFEVLYNRFTATVPDASDLLGTFLWPSDFNGTTWHDPETVALLNEANIKTGAVHLALLEQAERRVMNAVPSVPTMFERRQTMLAAEVTAGIPIRYYAKISSGCTWNHHSDDDWQSFTHTVLAERATLVPVVAGRNPGFHRISFLGCVALVAG